MSVLILKNVEPEGPGTIEDFLRESSIPYRIVELYREGLPEELDFKMLVMLGGPMSVNEEHIYPFLKKERELAHEFIAKGKKVFGVCLGAQIMAKALGGKVYPGPQKEIGWYDIEVVGEGIRDPLMNKLAVHPAAGDFWKKFKVFHWHGETFELPAGAERLARSSLYENQAFRYGNNAYAFQFHIEVKRDMISRWLKDEPVDHATLSAQTEDFYAGYAGRAKNFYRAFFGTLK